MSHAMDWIKSNLIIVICSVVVIIAVASLIWPTLSSGAAFRETLEDRANLMNDIRRLSSANVEIPAESPEAPPREYSGVTINPASVQLLEEMLAERTDHFGDLLQVAVQFNRRGPNGQFAKQLLQPGLFPDPTTTVRLEAQKAYLNAFGELYRRLGAGTPPTEAEIAALRERAPTETDPRRQTQQAMDPLRRMAIVNRAEAIELYADPPSTEQGLMPGMFDIDDWSVAGVAPFPRELWNGQIELWIQQDLVAAINLTNQPAEEGSVLTNPVKRVLGITVGDYVGQAEGSRIPTEPLDRDYSYSLTGRVTTPAYDVRPVAVSLIIESAHLPALLNAISAVNFMTPEVRQIVQVNEAEHFLQGYAYGEADVVQVDLWIETLWLRHWTAGHEDPDHAETLKEAYDPGLMPDSVRYQRGMTPRDPDFDTTDIPLTESYGGDRTRTRDTRDRGGFRSEPRRNYREDMRDLEPPPGGRHRGEGE